MIFRIIYQEKYESFEILILNLFYLIYVTCQDNDKFSVESSLTMMRIINCVLSKQWKTQSIVPIILINIDFIIHCYLLFYK